MGWGTKTAGSAVTFLAAALLTGAASAQNQPGPVNGTLTLSTGASVDTNPTLSAGGSSTEVKLTENATFKVTTDTRVQSLTLTGTGALQWAASGGGSGAVSFTNPKFDLLYRRDTGNADLTAAANFFDTEISTAYDIDPSNAVFLVVADGSLTTYGAGVTANFGKNGPLALTFGAKADVTDYSGTADPSLLDATTLTANAAASMRLSPVTQSNVTLSYTDYSAENFDASDVIDTTTARLGVTVSHRLKSALTVDGSVSVQSRDLTRNGVSTSRTGVQAGVKLTQGLKNGSVFGGVDFDGTGPLDRTSITVGRSVDFPAAKLSASATAADVEGRGLQVYGSASYDQNLPDGSLTLNFAQSLTTNQLDEDILTTNLGLTYRQRVTSTSNFGVAMNVGRIADGGAGSVTGKDRASLTASYNQSLNSDWDMSVGYRHRFYTTDTTPDANSDAVFLTLTRNIDFGF